VWIFQDSDVAGAISGSLRWARGYDHREERKAWLEKGYANTPL
jgi:hypothetical protein